MGSVHSAADSAIQYIKMTICEILRTGKDGFMRIQAVRWYFLLFLIFLTACGGSGSVVSTDGSTSMERVMGALIEGYREVDNSVRVNYSGTGSGAGIEAVLSGVCDIGLSSRALKDSEIEKGAVAHLVALDGITVVVNGGNAVDALTVRQLRLIFTGQVTDWAELGGSSAPIAVYGREAGSGTRNAFEEVLGIADRCAYTNEYSSNGDIVGNVSTNPNGIGYVSLSGVGRGVKTVRIDGVVCSEETIRAGSYPLQRPFYLVTAKDRALSQQAQAFLDYALSDAVAEYIAIAGAVAPDHAKE